MIGLVVVSLLLALTANLAYHYGGEKWQTLSFDYLSDAIITKPSILAYVLGTGVAIFVAFTIATFFFGFLMFGRLSIGASVAVGFHNWMNGAGFDLSLIVDALINSFSETSLNDFWGSVIGITWFLISTFVLNVSDDAVEQFSDAL